MKPNHPHINKQEAGLQFFRSDLKVAACVQGALVVQAVGPLVLRPAGLALLQRRAAASSSCQLGFLPLCEGTPKEAEEKTGRRIGAKKKWKTKRKTTMKAHSRQRKQNHRNCWVIFWYLLDEMMRDSVFVILPLGGNLSRNVSMLSISNSVVGVTASGCSLRKTGSA